MAIALAAVVLMLVPIGGGHVEEFEGAGVKFKFAIAASATNTTNQSTGTGRANSRSEAVNWYSFPPLYEEVVLPTRSLYAASMTPPEDKNNEALFIKTLSDSYMRPLAAVLACDETVVPPAASSESRADFVKMINAWRVFALRKSDPSEFPPKDQAKDQIEGESTGAYGVRFRLLGRLSMIELTRMTTMIQKNALNIQKSHLLQMRAQKER
jgi:hypothetical protein